MEVFNLGLTFCLRRALLITCICGLILVAITLCAGYTTALPSLIIGITTSILYQLMIQRQLRKSSHLRLAKLSAYVQQCSLSRFCLIISAAILVILLPNSSIIAFLLGALIPFRLCLFCDVIASLITQQQKPGIVPTFTTSITHPLLRSRRH